MTSISQSSLRQLVKTHGISTAELEALALALAGQPADKIALQIGISAVAVRKRLGAVYKKFGIAGNSHGKLVALRDILAAQAPIAEVPLASALVTPAQDWGEAIDVSDFYGRTAELAALQHWITVDRCRLIALLGMGGIGKSSLSIKLAQQLVKVSPPEAAEAAKFDFVIWRSLRHAPLLAELLADLLSFLPAPELTEANAASIPHLLKSLRQHRCLIVLDNLESILGDRAGYYRLGYENYGDLWQQLGEVPHQSCVVLTSREQPKEIAALEGANRKVRSLVLSGLDSTEAQLIMQEKGAFTATHSEWERLIVLYGGNPLALKIVATTIQDLFGSSISEFLRQNTAILVSDMRNLLDQQFRRLTTLEKDILYWLAINCKPTTFLTLQDDIISADAPVDVIEALEALKRRSLIDTDRQIGRFTLQPVVMEYVVNQLIDQLGQELTTPVTATSIGLFKSHTLLKAQAAGRIQSSQRRLLLAPIGERLAKQWGSNQRIKDHLMAILDRLRQDAPLTSGYAGGNAINLLRSLKIDLTGCDFSGLKIWQANLKGLNLHSVNFSHADLAKTVFTGILDSILTVAFSPGNGELLATGDADGRIGLWRATHAEQIKTWKAHENWVRAVIFSPDGKLLISCSDDYTVKLWDGATGHLLKTLEGHSSWVRAVAVSPDGRILASASSDATVRLWDLLTYQCVTVLTSHESFVRAVAFSPDGSLLATCSVDRTIKLWNLAQQCVIATLTGHTSAVQSIAFSPDGSLLASGGDDKTVRLWQVPSGELLASLEGHIALVQPVAFSPDGSLLASGGDGKVVKLWDVPTRRCVATLAGHVNAIQSLAFSPDGQTLATGSDDKTVRLWDVQTGQRIQILQGYTHWIHTIALSPDQTLLASGSDDSTIRLWDLATGACVRLLEGHTSRIWSVMFSPDGQTLASASDDRTAKVWEVATGNCQQTLRHEDWVRSVAFSPDGQTLATGNVDRTVKLWHVDTGQQLAVLAAHTNWVRSVVWRSDGQQLASCGDDATVRLWSLPSGHCLNTLVGHHQRVWTVAFSPDGQIIATGSDDKTVKLWQAKTGECLQTISHQYGVRSVAFSPDGQTLATAGMDQTINLWNLATQRSLRTLAGHSNWVRSLIFKDNQTLVSGSQDGTIKVWEVDSGACWQTLIAPRPYEAMNIHNVTGLTAAQKNTLKELGAVEV